MSGMNRMVNNQVTLLAGERRCRTIVAATNRVNGMIRMPTNNIVPTMVKKKCQKELGINAPRPYSRRDDILDEKCSSLHLPAWGGHACRPTEPTGRCDSGAVSSGRTAYSFTAFAERTLNINSDTRWPKDAALARRRHLRPSF